MHALAPRGHLLLSVTSVDMNLMTLLLLVVALGRSQENLLEKLIGLEFRSQGVCTLLLYD